MRIPAGLRALPLLIALAGCVAPKAPPPQPPAPKPQVPPAQAPLAQPDEDWRDIPLTPGTWRYTGDVASYGPAGAPVLTLRCDRAARLVLVSRHGAPGAMSIQTSAGTQAFNAALGGLGVQVSLRASDPFLDKIAFSRGRFTVSLPGAARLVIPAWAEPGRVIEDCR
jgi:hypothetical protein